MELEKRLGLYQVFLKIYEHNRGLLDEILQLENSPPLSVGSQTPAYIQGVVQGQQAYIITNLVNGRTQRLFQPQKIWILGRDSRVALTIQDRWMSRHHAAIHYIHDRGFYLVDLNSTNGSFVNGEPILQRLLLQDGDRVRLGSAAISFFLAETSQNLASLPSDLQEKINSIAFSPAISAQKQSFTSFLYEDESEDASVAIGPNVSSERLTSPSLLQAFSQSQRSQILDRFLGKRKMPTK